MTTKPWEEMGYDVSESDSLGEAMAEAHVLFNVSVRPGYFVPFDALHSGKKGNDYRTAEGHFYIVRDDIDIVLGAVKTKFQPLQNDAAFAFFQPLIDNGTCKIDTIGSFGKGQKVWMLAEITNARYSVVEGDDISLYLILINAHDGSTCVMVGLIPIRICCSNMFSMLNRSEFQIVKFKHTGSPLEKLGQVSKLINEQLRLIEGFVKLLKTLTQGRWPSPRDLNIYFRLVFNMQPESKASTQSNNKIKRLQELFIQGRGNQRENVRGTWYAAYNAVSEFLNYEAGRSAETRLSSLWFGVNNNINSKALTIALESKQYSVKGD